MRYPSSIVALALILPLLTVQDQLGAGETVGPPTASPPNIKIAQINPYLPLTEQVQPEANGKPPPPPCSQRPCENPRMWHAFVLVGTDTLFASHITNLFLEVHKYHLVIEISLPEPCLSKLMADRERHPADSFFMANAIKDVDLGRTETDPINLPEVAAGLRTSFIANVWHGVPNKPVYDHWPWKGVRPICTNVEVAVDRIVHFMPFTATMNHPDRLTYLLFGSGDKAYLMHIQTMHRRKPDFDHVASLKEAPDWLAQDLLQAGAVIDLPDHKRFGNIADEQRGSRCKSPFENGAKVDVRYRGIDIKEPPRRAVTIGSNMWFCTRIANKTDPCREVNKRACGSETPKEYLSP